MKKVMSSNSAVKMTSDIHDGNVISTCQVIADAINEVLDYTSYLDMYECDIHDYLSEDELSTLGEAADILFYFAKAMDSRIEQNRQKHFDDALAERNRK